MRISDWSSDVCSSDLPRHGWADRRCQHHRRPAQRMTDEERAIVKDGGIPETWAAKPARLAQKDRDVRWTLKRGRRKKGPDGKQIGRASCRERVCQYV